MDRRAFIKSTTLVTCGCVSSGLALPLLAKALAAPEAARGSKLPRWNDLSPEERLRYQYLDVAYTDDIYLDAAWRPLAKAVSDKLLHCRTFMPRKAFQTMSIVEAYAWLQKHRRRPYLSKMEQEFVDYLFHLDPSEFGFKGERTIHSWQSQTLPAQSIVAVENQFLEADVAYPLYRQLKKDIGPNLYLTSGIRGVWKQTAVFVNKLVALNYNLSQASRNVAPPAYSFHACADFDVGSIKVGEENFTAGFAQTREYQEMLKLAYVDWRYPANNQQGVRFEPWHIKVVR